jgi:hypothetical protein
MIGILKQCGTFIELLVIVVVQKMVDDDDDDHASSIDGRIMGGVSLRLSSSLCSVLRAMNDENDAPSKNFEKQKSCKFSKIHLLSDTINK